MNKHDHDLFCKLCAPTHALNHLLPPTRNMRLKEVISKIKHFRLELKYFATAHRSLQCAAGQRRMLSVTNWRGSKTQSCDARRSTDDPVMQWRRQDFVTGGSEVWVYRGSGVRTPPVPVVLSVYQRGSLLDGLAMYMSCDTKKFHDNESTHILHNFWTSSHRGEASPLSTWRRHCCHAVRHSERPAQCTHGMMRRAGPSATAGTC